MGQQRSSPISGVLPEPVKLEPLRSVALRNTILADVTQGDEGSVDWQNVSELALRAPLDPIPFEIGLAQRAAEAPRQDLSGILYHLLKRNPRSFAAGLHRFQQAARTQDLDALLSEYERMLALDVLESERLDDALIGVFRTTGKWDPLVEYLESRPSSGARLTPKLFEEAISLSSLETVVAAYPDIQTRYLTLLIERGLLNRAYSSWRRYANWTSEAQNFTLFNGDFSNQDAPQPFNWKLHSGFAEYMSNGGLYVSFRGNADIVVAEKITSAPPGQFILRVQAEGQMPPRGPVLSWQFSCYPGVAPLGEIAISLDRIYELQTFEETVLVPQENCDFQVLMLQAHVSEYPKASRVKIASVELIHLNP